MSFLKCLLSERVVFELKFLSFIQFSRVLTAGSTLISVVFFSSNLLFSMLDSEEDSSYVLLAASSPTTNRFWAVSCDVVIE